MFGLAARLIGCDAALFGLAFRPVRAPVTDIGEDRRGERAYGQDRTDDSPLVGPTQRAACREFTLALLGEQLFGGIAGLAFVAQVAAAAHDTAQDVMGQFNAADIKALFDAQQPTVDENREGIGAGACSFE